MATDPIVEDLDQLWELNNKLTVLLDEARPTKSGPMLSIISAIGSVVEQMHAITGGRTVDAHRPARTRHVRR